MAIHIDWQVLPSSRRKKGEQPQLYPRLVDNEVVDFHKLCEKVSNHSSKTIGTVIGIVSDAIDVMKNCALKTPARQTNFNCLSR